MRAERCIFLSNAALEKEKMEKKTCVIARGPLLQTDQTFLSRRDLYAFFVYTFLTCSHKEEGRISNGINR